MKYLKLFLLCGLLTLTRPVVADTPPQNPELVQRVVSDLLKHHELKLEKDFAATVQIAINQDREIVVLDVLCDSKMVKDFIRRRLNYEKVEGPIDPTIRKYVFPVRITRLA